MLRNKIYAITEGHGESRPSLTGEQPAVVRLIARILDTQQCYTLFPEKRVRRLKSKGDFLKADLLENNLRQLREREDCAAVVVLFDADEDDECPWAMARQIVNRIRQMERLPFSVVVVCARREYEAWFLASLETIQEEPYAGDPEARRGVKEWLKKRYGYRPTRDQAHYSQEIDIGLACNRSRSFRRLYHAVEELVAAANQGEAVITPNLSS